MSVEEYYLKFPMLSRYAPSLVFNQSDEMSRFVIGGADVVREECRTVMLHNDMTLDGLIMYAQTIEESKHTRNSSNLKRNSSSDQEEPRSVKVKLNKGGGSQNVKPTCVTCGKRRYGECLKSTV